MQRSIIIAAALLLASQAQAQYPGTQSQYPSPYDYTVQSQPPAPPSSYPTGIAIDYTPNRQDTWGNSPYAPMVPPVMRDQPTSYVNPMVPPVAR